jgi:hypothetical protein
LSIGKDSDHTLIEYIVQDGSDGEEVEVFIGLLVGEGVVEGELRVVHVLGDSIHSELALMNYDVGVGAGDAVYLTIGQLTRKDWPLLDTHTDLDFISWFVLQRVRRRMGDLLGSFAGHYACSVLP